MNTSPATGANQNADLEIAHRIKIALIRNNTNAKSLSERTSIGYRPLLRSLSGKRCMTVQEVADIAQALNISPSTLLLNTLTESEDAA